MPIAETEERDVGVSRFVKDQRERTLPRGRHGVIRRIAKVSCWLSISIEPLNCQSRCNIKVRGSVERNSPRRIARIRSEGSNGQARTKRFDPSVGKDKNFRIAELRRHEIAEPKVGIHRRSEGDEHYCQAKPES